MSCVKMFSFSFLILFFALNSPLTPTSMPTSTSVYPAENSQPSTTFIYELMDTEIDKCTDVHHILISKNLTDPLPESPIDGTGLKVCRSKKTCCTHQMEDQLRWRVQHDFQNLIHHSSKTIQGLLASTASELERHMLELIINSENNSMSLFSDDYSASIRSNAQTSIGKLYGSISDYVKKRETLSRSTIVPPEDSKYLIDGVIGFFADMFPLVYKRAVRVDFSDEYRECVKNSYDEIRPFGDKPKEIAADLAGSLEAVRTLGQALVDGSDLLNTTDLIMASSWSNGALDGCFQALVRLFFCPRCQGIPSKIKPCNGYCLNVMRGCLTQQRAQELDLPWNNFLNEIQRLSKQLDKDNYQSLSSFTTKIDDTFLSLSMNGPAIHAKVTKKCGDSKLPAESVPFSSIDQKPTRTDAPISLESRSNGENSRLLSDFLKAIDSTQAKGFFANLAEAMCSDDTFAETRDTAECWNGQRIGEYTKTLVRPGVDEKYNPELVWVETDPDPNIRVLSDKLRHIRQVVMSQLKQTNSMSMDSFMSDEEAGSGSGERPTDDDEEPIDEEGSGSGDDNNERTNPGVRKPIDHHDITNGIPADGTPKDNVPQAPGKNPNGASIMKENSIIIILAFSLSILYNKLFISFRCNRYSYSSLADNH